MTETAEQYQEMRDIWGDYNDRQKFEHDLINRKTTWLLTTQTIIFAAYGITFQSKSAPEGPDQFRDVIAWSGLAIAVIVLFGVLFLIRSKARSWEQYATFFDRSDAPSLPRPLHDQRLEWGVSTRNTTLTLLPDVFLPIVFIVGWLVLIF